MRVVGLKGNKADLHLSLEKASVQVGEVYKATDQAALGQLMTFLTQALKTSAVSVPSLSPWVFLTTFFFPVALAVCVKIKIKGLEYSTC